MKPVNEGSSKSYTVRFYDRDGQEATPSTVDWNLVDVASGKVIQDWTSIAPSGSSVQIEVSPTLNVILDNRKAYEEHCLTVKADADLPGQHTEELRFKVKNMKGFK